MGSVGTGHVLFHLVLDLILPETDAGVLVQTLLFAMSVGVGLWLTRERNEYRLVVIGLALVGLGFIGFRALH